MPGHGQQHIGGIHIDVELRFDVHTGGKGIQCGVERRLDGRAVATSELRPARRGRGLGIGAVQAPGGMERRDHAQSRADPFGQSVCDRSAVWPSGVSM